MPKKITKKTTRRVGTVRIPTVTEDFKTAALLVSVTINLVVFIGWLALKITTKYDLQVATFLFSR